MSFDRLAYILNRSSNRFRWLMLPALFLFFIQPVVVSNAWTHLTASAPALDPASEKKLQKVYGNLPLRFEKNQGQTDSQVRFLSRGSGYSLFLTPAEAVLAVHGASSKPGNSVSQVVRMRLMGGNRLCSLEGLDPLKSKSNYLIGNDPENWRRGVGNFGRVSAREVYPGIDMVYYGNQGRLEYDFQLKPGADPKEIRLKFQGARKVRIDPQGNLALETKAGPLVFQKPVVYQGGGTRKVFVAGKFVGIGRDEIGFSLGAYDKSAPLVIDPTLVYSTYLGGSGGDFAYSIAVDGAGSAYVTGWTASTNFPTTAGAVQTLLGGNTDVFVSKFNPAGSALVYSTFFGGTSADEGQNIKVDSAGDAYVTGYTFSINFPYTAGAFQTTRLGSSSAFVVKLNPGGTAFIYSTYLGGSLTTGGYGIDVDSAGDAFVTGQAALGTFPTTAGAFQTSSSGTGDAFVAELNPAGSALVYSTYLGGSGNDWGYGIAVDASGNAYVTGYTTSSDFPTTGGALQSGLIGLQDAFVVKLNSTGSALVYSTYLGGISSEVGYKVAVDAGGNLYVVGSTSSTNFPTTAGAYQTALAGNGNAFLTKLNSTGGLVYSTYLGGNNDDLAFGIQVDSAGDAYVTGYTSSSNFPTTAGAYQPADPGIGSTHAFVSEFNPAGSGLLYSTYFGGSSADGGYGLALDTSGNVYLAGDTYSSNFPTTSGAYQTSAPGTHTAWAAKLSFPNSVPTPVSTVNCGPGQSFSDGFANSGSLSNYTFTDEHWDPSSAAAMGFTVTGGAPELVENPPAGSSDANGGYLSVNNALFSQTNSDYTVEGDFEMDQAGGLFGLVFRQTAVGQAYIFQWNSTNWEIEKQTATGGFGYSYLGSFVYTPAYVPGTWVHLKVVVTGSLFNAYVNFGSGDQQIFSNISDPGTNLAPYASGGVGIRTFNVYQPNVVRAANFQAYTCAALTATATPTPTPACVPTTVTTCLTSGDGGDTPGLYTFSNPALHGWVDSCSATWVSASIDTTDGGVAGKSFTDTRTLFIPAGVDIAASTFNLCYGMDDQMAVTVNGAAAVQCTNSGGGICGTGPNTILSPSLFQCGTNTIAFTVHDTAPASYGGEFRFCANLVSGCTGAVCGGGVTPTPSLTMTPSPTFTPTPSLTPTITPTLTVTPSPTLTLSPTPSPTATPPCQIHVWPVPFSPQFAQGQSLKISCLPEYNAQFSVYTVSGEWVNTLSPAGDPTEWNGKNHGGVLVSPGIYYYVVVGGQKALARGKLLVIP